MPVKSYGFAIGNLRAKENTLLRSNDLTQLAALPSVERLAGALRDKGFGERTSIEDVPTLIKNAMSGLWDYLNEIAPDDGIFRPFLLENDFHNLKAALKAVIRNIDPSPYFLLPATLSPDIITEAARERKFELLPEYMKESAERSCEILLSNGDSQLCDAVLDRACMNTQLSLVNSKNYPYDLGRQIIEKTVTLNNIKAALRCAKANKDVSFINETLADTSYPAKDALKKAALSGEEDVLELMEKSGRELSFAAESFKKSPQEFEKFCDDAVMAVARRGKSITFGVEPIIGYYMARSAEIRNIRIIYSGIKTGQPHQQITERLRALYG